MYESVENQMDANEVNNGKAGDMRGKQSGRSASESCHRYGEDNYGESTGQLHPQHTPNTFVPVVCSIFGVIIFMRLGTIVGSLGLLYAILTITVAFVITFITIGSVSAITSAVDASECGNGLFGALRCALGERLSHMNGVMLYLAFSVGGVYYLLGLSEISLYYFRSEPISASWVTTIVSSVLLAIITLTFTAGIKLSRTALAVVFVMVLVAIGCNIVVLLVQLPPSQTQFSTSRLRENTLSIGRHMQLQQLVNTFSKFFPAFCGVIAGVNLAEHIAAHVPSSPSPSSLREHPRPTKRLIVGIHKGLGFSYGIYLILSFVLAASINNDTLRNQQFVVPTEVDSVLVIPVMYITIALTTLTSAFSNLMGAVHILTTLIKDASTPMRSNIGSRSEEIPLLRLSARSSERSSSVHSTKAVLWTWMLMQTALICGSVDKIIPLVSATFLLSFACLNFSCFFQEVSPGAFSPSFRMYSKWTVLLGCVFCLAMFFLVVSPIFIILATIALVMYAVVYREDLQQTMELVRAMSKGSGKQKGLTTGSTNPLSPVDFSSLKNFHDDDSDDGKLTERFELAALYVRDAIRGRYLGDEYLLQGMHRMHYKRAYMVLRCMRIGNMCVLLALMYFEAPSWCFFLSSCGNRDKILTWNLPILPQQVTIAIEFVCLLLLAIEMVVKYSYMGQRVYLVNKWRVFQLVILITDAAAVLIVALSPRDHEFTKRSIHREHELAASRALLFTRLVRPVLLVTMSHRLRSGFGSLLKALPRFMDGLLTIVVIIALYAICGMILFEGTDEAHTYFTSFADSCISLLVLMTTANYPDVMMPIYSQVRFSSVYFITFLMMTQLLVLNLVFSSIYHNYRQEVSQRALRYASKRTQALQAAFQLLPGIDSTTGEQVDINLVDSNKIITGETYERLIMEIRRPAVSLFRDYSKLKRGQSESISLNFGDKDKGQKVIDYTQFVVMIKSFFAGRNSPRSASRIAEKRSTALVLSWIEAFVLRGWFDKCVDIIILGNLFVILVEIQAKMNGAEQEHVELERWMPMFSGFYLVEMLLKWIVYGLDHYFDQPKNVYDCVVTVVISVAEVSVHLHSNIAGNWEWIRFLLLLRFLRCLRLLVALQSLSSLFATIAHLIPSFTTLYGMLGIVMTEFALVGMELFGGKIIMNDPALANITFGQSNYYSNNFNDFASSMITLFELLIVNNWFVIMDGIVAVTSKWSRLYFVSFYIVGVVMVLSLVVAFVVEAYFESHPADKKTADENQESETVAEQIQQKEREADKLVEHLVTKRSLGIRPRGDSIYVDEFL